MTLKIPNVGELELLKVMLSGAPAQPMILKLYVNDWTPTDTDTTATYTEMSSHGYVAKDIPVEGWTFQRLVYVAEATHTVHTWAFEAGVPTPVFGYYLVGAVDGILRWAERFNPTFSAELLGDTLMLTPKITFSSY